MFFGREVQWFEIRAVAAQEKTSALESLPPYLIVTWLGYAEWLAMVGNGWQFWGIFVGRNDQLTVDICGS